MKGNIIVVLICWLATCFGLNVQMFPLKEYCFGVMGNQTYHIEYVISGINQQRAKMEVKRNQNQQLFTQIGKEYKGEVDLPVGDIELCFSTTDNYPKVLSVDFFTATSDLRKSHGVLLTKAQEQLSEAAQKLNSVYRNQHYQMTRDQTHRQILEDSQMMLKWIGGIKILLIVILTATQLFIMKGFISRNTNKYTPI